MNDRRKAQDPASGIDIIGIGEDGVAGLSTKAYRALEAADVIIGGERHHQLSDKINAERIAWPSPFDALIETIRSLRNRRLVILATGDPLWFSVGARIKTSIAGSDITFHPQLSAFQWAACRMGWSLADVETLTAHGRPAEQIIPAFWPGAKLLILTSGAKTPGEIARLLDAHGYGGSEMTVLANLGGSDEQRYEASAADWASQDPKSSLSPFHTLAVHCLGAPTALLSRLPGLPDDAFQHDGKMTKRDIRAITMAKLMPARGEVLWDIGTGCGSIGVEWMRAAPDAVAMGIDIHPGRLEMARANSIALGVPRLTLLEGAAPEVLHTIPAPVGTKPDLRHPDAVFIGGGLSEATAQAALQALEPNGRLVANAVTLESETVLIALRSRLGGELTRLSVAQAEPVGSLTGWRPTMPVTQWSLVK